MAQERDISARIRSLDELAEIVTAIRAIAASQMQQAARSSEAIGRYSELVRKALSDAASLLPPGETIVPTARQRGLVVFGAEHGLCGGFNQQLMRAVQHAFQKKSETPIFIVVGSWALKLCVSSVGFSRPPGFLWPPIMRVSQVRHIVSPQTCTAC